MKKQSVQFPNLIRSLRLLSLPAVILMLLLSFVITPSIPTAWAAASDISIDFAAAAPYSYNHLTGGGAYDDGTIGVEKDIVRSLQGGDFVCGDIVTFFAAVTVESTQTAINDGSHTIEMDFSFLMDTTGQSGVAIGDIVGVQVNYDPIEDLIAGEDTVDQGIVDDGDSVATLIAKDNSDPLFTPGSLLTGTIRLTGLEAGENVVVRIDTKLFCDPGSDPTGNLQADYQGARLTYVNETIPVEPPDIITGGGEQTIPFQEIAQIIFLDFGDLPAAYGLTTLAVDGARHGLSDLRLGSLIDDETDGQEDLSAVGDDINPIDANDEDGIVRPVDSNWSDGDGEVLVTVTGGYGCLTAWLDFTNGTNFGPNDSFDDSYTQGTTTYNELVIENQLLPAGTTQVNFDLPLGAANDYATFFARFRLVPAINDDCGEAPGLTGFVLGGEVEDYAISFGPTAVTLVEFEASPSSGVPTIWLAALALLGVALLGFAITRLLRSHPSKSKP